MLTKLCGHCGRTIKINEQCSCQKARHKEYDKLHRNKESAAVYHDKRWRILSNECKRKCNGLDYYALITRHKIVKGALAHHIVEITEDMTKAYDQDNLIYVSEKSHKRIHEVYKKSPEAKKEMQAKLRSILTGVGGRQKSFV